MAHGGSNPPFRTSFEQDVAGGQALAAHEGQLLEITPRWSPDGSQILIPDPDEP